VRPAVLGLCTLYLNDYHCAEDVTQLVACRAWSGYKTLRDRQAFKAWVFKIARREVQRVLGKRNFEIPVPDPQPMPPPALADQALGEEMKQICDRAVSLGVISGTEADILWAKAEQNSWEQIATRLNLSPANCATMHCRAVPKLRVFILQFHPERVGGIERIQRVFRDFVQTSPHVLTPAEADTFRRVIIEQDRFYRWSRWRSALRSACNKLARDLGI
jgi:DNA-directed RNA polymerase specialized sigma24 family protein